MKHHLYQDTRVPVYCGTCHRRLVWQRTYRLYLLSRTRYVHADTGRFRCRWPFGPNAQTRGYLVRRIDLLESETP